MTAYCQTASPLLGAAFASRYDTGVSDVAVRLNKIVNKSIQDYLTPRLDQLAAEIAEVVVDSHNAIIPVDQNTQGAALRFAFLLPRSVPLPEISPDPDGEISFDWFGASGKTFSVSINKSGRLSYAGWFGENSRIHGTETLVDSIPEDILHSLIRATR